jgi:hypothetical protein
MPLIPAHRDASVTFSDRLLRYPADTENPEMTGLMRQGFSQPATPGEWCGGLYFQQQP